MINADQGLFRGQARAGDAKDTYVLFNSCLGDYAQVNARQLATTMKVWLQQPASLGA